MSALAAELLRPLRDSREIIEADALYIEANAIAAAKPEPKEQNDQSAANR